MHEYLIWTAGDQSPLLVNLAELVLNFPAEWVIWAQSAKAGDYRIFDNTHIVKVNKQEN